ncbi:hypothetical protein HNQ93_001717 [Hymenobacter luteus]|uniref:PLD phosphodiesterase domain-containing protein n=2 Tax=Hymenobacter TaxID=89966 RepID=A0A7W9SZZ1_9BACT|nr:MULTISPECIES: hypothetical protein [Hymenobacter]MBB4600922.1 hypothetical protein [Hymenobacter latericoloratus]MBB6058871.1 hypothetical protein [Hymenobacter luteus]
MRIPRQNYLEALGKGHYHSCILTCYTFDFQFFELRVMRQLRAAGIQNILVLTDGPLLEYVSASASGREFQESSGFTIYPIYRPQGVFHPKLALFFGAKEGLLALGSGNLTASGLGGNDEAWGCFHVANPTAPNAALFADAWHYTQQLTATVQGMAATKLAWIRQFTPWLAQLPPVAPGTLRTLDHDVSVALLTNTDSGILSQTLDHLASATVERIVTVSPYYDQAGQVLSYLLRQFPRATVQCVVEDRLGLLPTDFPAPQPERLTFHYWSECGPDEAGTPSRLHAKLLHFTTDEGEFLLLGSANVTTAGMGAGPQLARNAEASLLLHHPSARYLTGLGIKPSKQNAVKLAAIQRQTRPAGLTEEGGSDEALSLPVRIVLAEMEPRQLTIHLAYQPAPTLSAVHIRLFSPRGVEHESPLRPLTHPLVTELPEQLPVSINRVELVAPDGTVVGRQFVQHPARQEQYCPDPTRRKLQEGFDALLQSGFEGFANLVLDLVEIDADDTPTPGKGTAAAQKPSSSATTVLHLSPEEFNQQKADDHLRQQGLLSSSSVQIGTFLNEVSKRLYTPGGPSPASSSESDFAVGSEEEEDGQSIDLELALQRERTKQAVRELKSLDRFLRRYLQQQQRALVSVEQAIVPPAIKLPPLSVRDLAVFNIALHTALYYTGRSFTTEHQGTPQQEWFMFKGGELHEYDTHKGFCAQFIGNFLLQYTAGLQHYQHPLPHFEARVAELRQSCLLNALLLVLTAPWRKPEYLTRDLLLANLLHYLRPTSWNLAEVPQHLESHLTELAGKLLFPTATALPLLRQLLPTLAPRLQAHHKNLKRAPAHRHTVPANKVKTGDWLFLGKLGICAVMHQRPTPQGLTFTLHRPGLPELSEEYGPCFRYQQLQPNTGLLTL